MSYWLQKKYSRLGVKESQPETILNDFMEAYDLQLQLITPDMRKIWVDEFQNDPKSTDRSFIKVNNIEQLRRLFSNTIYGTK